MCVLPAAGIEVFQQIELDMHRLSALYVVERMKPRLMPYLLTLLSQQQETRSRAKAKARIPKSTFGGQPFR